MNNNFYDESKVKDFPLTPACERAVTRAEKDPNTEVELNGFWWSVALVKGDRALEVEDDFHKGEWVGCTATRYVFVNDVWVTGEIEDYATLASFQGDLEGWLADDNF